MPLRCVGFASAAPAFPTSGNLLDLLRQSAPLLVVAVAITVVATTGGVDPSVGSPVALASVLCAIGPRAGLL